MTYHNRSILIQQILKYMVMVAMSVFALAPFLFLLLSSLRPGAQMVQNGLTLDFDLRTMSLEGYRILMNYSEGLYFNWYTTA